MLYENVTATSSYCHVKLPIKHIHGKKKKKSNPPLTLSQSKTLPKVEKSPCRSSAEHVALMLPTNTLVELGGRARDSSTTRGLPRYSLPSRCRMALRRHGCNEVKPTHAWADGSHDGNKRGYLSAAPSPFRVTKAYCRSREQVLISPYGAKSLVSSSCVASKGRFPTNNFTFSKLISVSKEHLQNKTKQKETHKKIKVRIQCVC